MHLMWHYNVCIKVLFIYEETEDSLYGKYIILIALETKVHHK